MHQVGGDIVEQVPFAARVRERHGRGLDREAEARGEASYEGSQSNRTSQSPLQRYPSMSRSPANLASLWVDPSVGRLQADGKMPLAQAVDTLETMRPTGIVVPSPVLDLPRVFFA